MQQQETSSTEMFEQSAPQASEPKAAPVAEEAKKEQEAPIYLGGKKFANVEELAAYTSKLENDRAASAQWSSPAAASASQEKPLSELIFEDPEKALALHEQKVIQKIKAEEVQKQNEQRFWSDFYKDNKDLVDENDLVNFVMNKHWSELSALHPDQASKKIAEYTRKTILKYKGDNGVKTELPSGQAKVGPSGTRSAPVVAESRPQTVDFVSQLKKIQGSRK